jgi:hypothetical protein
MPGARDRLCWSHPHTVPRAAPLQIRARLGSKESGSGLGVANRWVLAPRRAGTGTGRFAMPGDKSLPAITGGTCSSVETSQQCTGRARAPLSLRPAACRLEVGHGSGAANGAPRVASPSLGCGSSLVPSSGTGQLTGPSPGDRLGAAESVERAVRVGNVLDASVQIGIGQRAGHSRAQYLGRRKLSDQSGGTVEQRPAGDGEIKARLGASGGGRSRHHCYCWPGRPYTLVVTEGRRRRRGGTREAEAGRRSATGPQKQWVSPGTVSHRNQPDAEAQRRAARMWNGHVRPLV